jgi:predicted metal-binding membrane protein
MTSTEAERGHKPNAVVLATLGAAFVCWILTIQRMAGMDMGPGTKLGSFAFFIGVWVLMMAAMMLPSVVPGVASFYRGARGRPSTGLFIASYLVVWSAFGVAVYPLYRPHGAHVAGAMVALAGLYELSPLKRACRRRCRLPVASGVEYARYCVGSSVGLMLVLLALGPMSTTWMAVVTGIVFWQKALPVRPYLDRALAVALVALGLWVAATPSSVPGLRMAMTRASSPRGSAVELPDMRQHLPGAGRLSSSLPPVPW